MKALRIILGIHVLFFLGWGYYLLTVHSSGVHVWLETRPVDPRDYLSGNYVALTFEINNPNPPTCPEGDFRMGQEMYVMLKNSGRKLNTAEGTVPISEVAACRNERPHSETGEIWVKGTRAQTRWGRTFIVQYGIERFYVSEGNPLRHARSGEVVAKISVNKSFQARILNLVKIAK